MICKEAYAVVRGPRVIANKFRNLGHGLDSDDALDSKVCLVREGPCEVIRAELIGGYQRVRDEKLGPLVEQAELQS